MMRSGVAGGVGAAVLALAGFSQPSLLPASEAPLLAPSPVGTWRLDSLVDQASVSGIAPSDVDPSVFVLHDLTFEHGDAGITAVELPFGRGKVTAGDGRLALHATGKAAAFRIPIPRNDEGEPLRTNELGMIALRLRSTDASEIALLRDLSQFGVGGMGSMPLPGFNPGMNFVVPMAGGAPPPAGAATGGAAAPVAGGAPPVAPPPPAAGPFGGGPRLPPGFDPRAFLGRWVAKLAADGEWHVLGRTKAQFSGNDGPMAFGFPEQAATIDAVTLAILVPAEKEMEGVTVELEYVHLLDSKADYAARPAAPCEVERSGVLHSGLYLNTPCETTWRLVPPERGRLIAGLTAIDDRPFTLYVHVTADGGRKTLLERAHSGETVEPIALDLSEYAGREIALTFEVVEEEEGRPTVAFLLQPLVHGERPDEVRNVLLYFCDTLRADALSCYGNERPTTPTLDALAQAGVRFERCFSQGAWTYVSMPSSLTGMFPSVNGVKTGGERIADSATTLAEAFRAAGYLTAAFVRNDFVGKTTNTAQGFDFFFPGSTVTASADDPEQRANQAGLQNLINQKLGRAQNDAAILGNSNIFGSGSSRDLFAKAEPWLRQYADVPFLLYLHAVDPHDPYDPDEADRRLFLTDEQKKVYDEAERKVVDVQTRAFNQQMVGPGGVQVVVGGPVVAAAPVAPAATATTADAAATDAATAQTPKPNEGTARGPVADAVAAAKDAPPAEKPEDPRRKMFRDAGIDYDGYVAMQRVIYDAEVHYFDRHMKRLLELFDALGLADRTVVSFNADHGEEFLDHDGMGHGQSVYAELNHVPWILRAPGLVPSGRVVPDSVMNVDLAPTLLGLCGVAVPESMQGRDLAAVLKDGEDVPPAPIFTERWGGGMFGGFGGDPAASDLEFLGQWAVIEGTWKTIVTRSADQAMGPDGKPLVAADGKPLPAQLKVDLEIYDLLTDMTDSKSLIETERPRAEAAAKRLEIWLREMRKLNERYAGEDTSNEDADAMLRALGYAQ